MMFRSLNEVLGSLDRGKRVYCGHEYTAGNLAFAASVEPSNREVTERLSHARAMRARNESTVGSPLSVEFATNPFLRCDSPELRRSMKLGPDATPVEVFAALRRAKDSFRPKAP
jgi:hydroxyacylglutathione hydrolase